MKPSWSSRSTSRLRSSPRRSARASWATARNSARSPRPALAGAPPEPARYVPSDASAAGRNRRARLARWRAAARMTISRSTSRTTKPVRPVTTSVRAWSMPSSHQDALDPGGQLARAERLGHVFLHPEAQPAEHIIFARPLGQHHDRDSLGLRIFSQRAHDLETIVLWHYFVQDDQVRSLMPGKPQCLFTVGR